MDDVYFLFFYWLLYTILFLIEHTKTLSGGHTEDTDALPKQRSHAKPFVPSDLAPNHINSLLIYLDAF